MRRISSPGMVSPISREVHAETHVGRAVQPLNKTFDNRARDQLQVLNLHQNLRIDESIRRRPV